MKKKYLLVCALAVAIQFSAQSTGMGINTTAPHPSAQMDITSDSKGLLLPRLTTAAINSLSSTAAEGLVVYNKDLKRFVGWDGTRWQNLSYEEQNTAPTASNVSISGNASVGANLIGNYTYADADSNPENGSVYSWKIADDNAGLNAAVISSATAKNYTATTSDEGKFLQFCVVPKSNIGVSPGVQACSAWFGAIAANTAPTASNLNVTGQFRPGGIITGSYAYADAQSDPQNVTASGSSYQWKIADDDAGTNLTNIAGGATLDTNKTYSILATDGGKFIQYCVTPVATSGILNGLETCTALTEISTTPLQTGTIAFENFDTGAYTTIANGGFSFTATGSPTFVNSMGVAPASPKYVTGNGLQSVNTTATLTSGTFDATNFTNNITFSLRLASFSNTGTTNGADAADIVTISFDTGSGFVEEVSFNSGNANQRWDFGNTTVVTSVFDGVAPSSSLSGNASTIAVTNLPNSVKRVRISLLNNAPAEEWVIDDVKLTAQ